ncbi:MAG: ubiquinol-cytochrome c reductase iron-sulfur subunit [Cyanomargarita calcarea GSE-NOS-MK-12-04C]|jgi:cytochrome b6-f complex iron-sulfur subunit|uniref:Ubiquinol-cytochrome c reductase iron-sulfur subunit n=1 Tax=Cyanomargarita calcarea GSE-NOS-MK-12-04C TaxID=2839659 RepID=A0A951QIU8_9CYAN|nr:ubiquinol-cytochrome c reductase iron-sulfur subunit [Cyanomargarita calcarea GSE-NOS-MK-12-04C]
MNRRNFITLFSVSLFLNCSPILFAASYAAKPKPKPKKKPSQSENWIDIGTIAELDKAGQIFKQKSSLGAILVIGTSKNNNLIAVNPTCTHLGCTVDWEAKENIFLCPCHASEFAADGKVINGLATKPLSTYKTKIEGNIVMVKRV